MGLLSWLTKSNALSLFPFSFNWSPTNTVLPEDTAAPYFTGIKILSENIAKMHPQIMDKHNRIIEGDVRNKMLMGNPNSYLNRQKFWKIMEAGRINNGDAYAYIKRLGGVPTSLHLLSPASVLGAKLSTSGILYYDIDFDLSPLVPMTGKISIRGEDLIHVSFGQYSGLFGVRALDVLKFENSVILKAKQTIDSFFTNNATSTLAIETNVDKASFATKAGEAADTFIEKYSAPQNAGKPIVLPPNTKLVPIGNNMVDAQVIEAQRYSREEIANLFGIPKSMFDANDSNESIEQQTRMFLSMTLSPILEAYIAELEAKILTEDEIAKGVHIAFNTEKLIDTDFKTRTDNVAMLVSKGIISPNAGAESLGFDKSTSPWADELWIQSQNNPISQYDKWGKNNSQQQSINNENKTNQPKSD